MSEILDNRVALVTGAGGAIGAATARRLGVEGYTVVCVDRDADSALMVAAGIPGAMHFAVDVTEATALFDLRQTLSDVCGDPCLVVNAAGVFFEHDLLTATQETFDQIMNVNLKGTFLTCQTFIPGFIEAGGGTLVNIASTAGLEAGPQRSIYAASKAAVILMTRCIAVDYGKLGIRANCVCPGLIDTPMAGWLKSDPVAYEEWRGKLPAQRIGRVEDVAGAVAFLASDDANYIYGSSLVVDGGVLA